MSPANARLSRALTGAAACLLAFAAPAQTSPDGETYAVLSMIGDDLSIVTYQPGVGSNLDRNLIEHLPLDGAQFDRVAVQSASAALKRALPGAATRTLTTTVRSGPASDDEVPVSKDSLQAVLDDIAPQLAGSDVHYLLVVSKHRGTAEVRVAHGILGSGKLKGIGFYIDPNHRMRSGATGHVDRGFIAPFVYVNVSLIDLRTGTVVHTESISEATAVATARKESALVPWEALTADEKVDFLDRLIRRAMATVVPHVVAAA